MGGRTEDGRDGVASVAFAVASAHLSLFSAPFVQVEDERRRLTAGAWEYEHRGHFIRGLEPHSRG